MMKNYPAPTIISITPHNSDSKYLSWQYSSSHKTATGSQCRPFLILLVISSQNPVAIRSTWLLLNKTIQIPKFSIQSPLAAIQEQQRKETGHLVVQINNVMKQRLAYLPV